MKRYTGKNTESDRLRITGDPKGNTRWQVFNSDVIQAFELDALLDVAETIVVGGLAREESRGAHYRGDFPQRDDVNWLKHLMAYRTWHGPQLKAAPVTITRFPPK
jgi:succinate dehydrogenase / fumarate reductase, flavoprotein subunit